MNMKIALVISAEPYVYKLIYFLNQKSPKRSKVLLLVFPFPVVFKGSFKNAIFS